LYAILRRKVGDTDDPVQPLEMPQGWRAIVSQKKQTSRVC